MMIRSMEGDPPADSLPCPTCRRPVPLAPERRPTSFPFCSERCRWCDLGAWFEGRRGVPLGAPLPEPERRP